MSGYNLELSETHELIRQTARDFAQTEVAPSTIQRDIEAVFPTEIIKKLVYSQHRQGGRIE